MIVYEVSGALTLVLFAVAGVQTVRANAARQAQLRAADFRSAQGYAFHCQRAALRRQGRACAFAAFMTMSVFAAMALVQLTQVR